MVSARSSPRSFDAPSTQTPLVCASRPSAFVVRNGLGEPLIKAALRHRPTHTHTHRREKKKKTKREGGGWGRRTQRWERNDLLYEVFYRCKVSNHHRNDTRKAPLPPPSLLPFLSSSPYKGANGRTPHQAHVHTYTQTHRHTRRRGRERQRRETLTFYGMYGWIL